LNRHAIGAVALLIAGILTASFSMAATVEEANELYQDQN
jgi:hypothetical protein